MSNEKKNIEIEAIGEFGLIEELTSNFVLRNDSSHHGVGDDCAIISTEEGQHKLMSSDMLVEGVHFNLSYMPLKSLGFKAVSVNVSDVYSMNGMPEQITVSLGVSSKFPVEALKELYAGIHAACEYYSVDLVGGDTTSSYSGLIISISVIGSATKNKIVYRSGAKENDLLIISGDVGSSYLGLQILEREKGVYTPFSLSKICRPKYEDPTSPDIIKRSFSLAPDLYTILFFVAEPMTEMEIISPE